MNNDKLEMILAFYIGNMEEDVYAKMIDSIISESTLMPVLYAILTPVLYSLKIGDLCEVVKDYVIQKIENTSRIEIEKWLSTLRNYRKEELLLEITRLIDERNSEELARLNLDRESLDKMHQNKIAELVKRENIEINAVKQVIFDNILRIRKSNTFAFWTLLYTISAIIIRIVIKSEFLISLFSETAINTITKISSLQLLSLVVFVVIAARQQKNNTYIVKTNEVLRKALETEKKHLKTHIKGLELERKYDLEQHDDKVSHKREEIASKFTATDLELVFIQELLLDILFEEQKLLNSGLVINEEERAFSIKPIDENV